MRIVIDGRLFGPRTGGGGLGRYTEELVRHLEMIDKENEYLILLRKENWAAYQPQNVNFKKILAPWRWYTLYEQIGIPLLIRKLKADLLHVPHFNVPIFSAIPFVVTIHDLILLQYPSIKSSTLNPIIFWLKYLGYRFVLNRAIKKSRRIIAVSHATKDTILKKFKIPESKITTIYSGYTKQKESEQNYKAQQSNNKPCLLTVGNAFPHKNLDRLLYAFCDIIKEQEDLKLILLGPDDRFRADLKKLAQKLNILDNVIFTGFVDETKLNQFYSQASAYIVPSLLEGFGFPGLEAQSHGAPVLASNIPAHREAFGEGAIYFDPEDISSIKKSIIEILNNPELQKLLRAKGLENYKRFDWTNTAQKTRQLYLEI